jgi:flagellar basal body rod protein FlgB
LTTTNPKSRSKPGESVKGELSIIIRNGRQQLGNNSVEVKKETANMTDNALMYSALLTALRKKGIRLEMAITGGTG